MRQMKVIPITSVASAVKPPSSDFSRDAGHQRDEDSDAALADGRGRALRDLRISITDRCNFRCIYCMPRSAFGKFHTFLSHGDLLSFEEITRLARRFVGFGVKKIRLTGGEPLLRKHMPRLVEQLAGIDGVELALTTNGVLLGRMARQLKDAGLHRVTVSLDALDDETFRIMNDSGVAVATVLDSIDAAAAAGLAPIKINMVVKRGINDHAVLELARHFRHSGHIVRFIEFMDVGTTNGWEMGEVVPSRQIVERINAVFPLEPINPNYPSEVASRWRYRDGAGEIGVVSSVTRAFCSSCTRLRLSTEGKLYTCLFAQQGHDLRALLRGGAIDEALDRTIAAIWRRRDDRYSEIRTANTAGRDNAQKIEMSYIGG